jgi:myo-inositol-1(or 4)-monophosphatase
MNYVREIELAERVARRAGELILSLRGRVDRLTKSHAWTSGEAVSEADRASQRLIVAAIRSEFPGDGIVGEESDDGGGITAHIPNPDGRNWVIDPIDGTNNFLAGLGNFCVCVGLMERGHPVVGVVHDPSRDETYAAATGLGARLNDAPIRVSGTGMGEASIVMLTSNLLDPQGRCPGWAIHLLSQTRYKLRILGSAALEAVSVAAGIADAAVTVNGKLWDMCAASAIVLEAGGVVCDLSGNDHYPFDLRGYAGAKTPFVCTTPSSRNELLELIRRMP